jgi:hypothetical protein
MINLVSRDDPELLIYTTHRIVNRMTGSHLQLQELRALPQNTADVHALVGVCGTWQAWAYPLDSESNEACRLASLSDGVGARPSTHSKSKITRYRVRFNELAGAFQLLCHG